MAAKLKRPETGSQATASLSLICARLARLSVNREDKMLDELGLWFWKETFWLPANMTWDVLKNDEDMTFPQPRELWVIGPVALGLLILRLIWER